jgi:hypothetical protein
MVRNMFQKWKISIFLCSIQIERFQNNFKNKNYEIERFQNIQFIHIWKSFTCFDMFQMWKPLNWNDSQNAKNHFTICIKKWHHMFSKSCDPCLLRTRRQKCKLMVELQAWVNYVVKMSPSHHQINIIWTNQKLAKGKKKTPFYLPKIKLECTYVYTRKGFYKNQGTN